ncbi:zinc-binding dehydrogenase [Neobacillus sp. NPDC093127]|uniref:MDR/zinc-dependent alcohol dehydrogenase-like family protein n=1 Tax=Neobacillus sp. NPDC093127 TaxID=3364296 RepID=UPI003825126E
MKAAALVKPGSFSVFDVDIPIPKPNEVLIRVQACGVCSSELGLWKNNNMKIDYPLFIGHEVSGIVDEVGDEVTQFSPGDRVTVFTEKGGYSEYVAVPEKAVIKIADHVPFELALGEPIACAMNGTKRSGVQVGDTVVMIGLGFMGSLILQGIKLKGASKIIAIDPREESHVLAAKLGVDVVLNSNEEELEKRVLELTGGLGADVVIESTGYQEPLNLATKLVKVRGRIVIFGYHQGGPRTIDLQTWNWKGLDIVNAHERDPDVYIEGMHTGIKLLNNHQLKMEPLVTHFFTIDQINDAFETAAQKPQGFIKAVIRND